MLINEKNSRTTPPYVAYRTFKTFVEFMKQQGIPAVVDRSYWGSNFSGTTGNQLTAALLFLKLIDDEKIPTNRLKALVGAKDVKHSDMLKQTCMDAFDFLFKGSFDSQTGTPAQLQKMFQSNFILKSSTTRKCIKFFIDMSNDAGIPISPFITSKKLSSKIAKNTTMLQNMDENTETSYLWETKMLEKFPSFNPAWPDDVKACWFKSFDELMRRGINKT